MNNIILMCLTCLFLSMSFSLIDTNNESSSSEELCASVLVPFGDNEYLKYKAYYNYGALWVGAGSVEFNVEKHIENKINLWHIKSLGKTNSSFDRVFKIRDTYETWIKDDGLLPVRFNREVQEGNYSFERKYEFVRDSNIVNSYYKIGEKHREQRVEGLSYCTQDMLSAMYYLRGVNMLGIKPGDEIPIDVLIDGKLRQLSIRYAGVDKLKTRLGTFNCLVFKPQLIKGDYFKEEDGLTVWLTNDKNRIPIRAQADILVGSIKADLSMYNSLNNVFSAKVK